MRRTVWIAIAAAALLLPVAASAAKPKEPDKKEAAPAAKEAAETGRKTADADAPVVIDNDTLAARYGEDRGPVSAVSGGLAGPSSADELEPVEPMPDALQEIEDDKARARSRAIVAAQLDAEIAGLEARIADLEKRILAIRNPFLPRPVIPEDEADAWSRLTAPQRVERTEEQIAEVRRQLDAARGRRERLASSP